MLSANIINNLLLLLLLLLLWAGVNRKREKFYKMTQWKEENVDLMLTVDQNQDENENLVSWQ
jgi:hypothetical protein